MLSQLSTGQEPGLARGVTARAVTDVNCRKFAGHGSYKLVTVPTSWPLFNKIAGVSMRGTFAVVCVFMAALGMSAQTDMTAPPSMSMDGQAYKIQIGPSLAFFGGAMNTISAEGRKTRPDFFALPAYGIAVYAPFGTGVKMGGRLDLGIISTGTRTRPYEFFDGNTSWEGYIRERYQYFTIAPSINLAGVNLGAGFNIPMSGQMWHPDRSSEAFDVDRSTMKLAIDVRLGTMIEVYSHSLGTLYVELQAKYYVTGLYNDDKYTMGNTVNQRGDPSQDFRTYDMLDNVPAGAQLGVSYLFDLTF